MPAPPRPTPAQNIRRLPAAPLLGTLALAVACGASWGAEARAAGGEAGVPFAGGTLLGPGPDRLSLGLGAFNVVGTDSPDPDDEEAASAQGLAELRLGRKLHGIGPMAGITANTDGGVYGYGGIYLDLAYGDFVLTPSAGIGGYARGDSKELGGVFEFHVSIEAAWQLEGGSRLGVRLMHLSNAWLHDENPGVESVFLTYTLPFGP